MDKPNEALQYTNLDDAAQCLREIGNQFICPPDDFFWRLADAIEETMDTIEVVWNTIPSTYDECDPMVQRHAAALSRLGDIVRREVSDGST